MRDQLRWLMIATHVPEGGGSGGMVRYTVELARALHARPDINLTIVTVPRTAAFFSEQMPSIGLRSILPLPTSLRSLLERESWAISGGGTFDVIQGTKHILPRRARGVRLLTVHDMLPLDRPWDFPLLKRRFLRGPYLDSIREADSIVCMSNAILDRLSSYVPSARERARIVPLAVASALISGPSEPVMELVGRRFALVVGDSSPRKNLSLLLRCWPQVLHKCPDAVLAVVGPRGWGPAAFGDEMAQLSDVGAVVQLGWREDSQLRWLYDQCRVACAPSLLEGFGLPAAEARALGAPLITSDDPALCEVGGPSALHLSPRADRAWAEAIVGLLDTDVERRRPPTSRGWDDVAAETVEVVRELG